MSEIAGSIHGVISGLFGQLQRQRVLLLALYAPVVAALACIALLRAFAGVEVGDLTRDPVQYYEGPAYIGVVSLVGGLIWAGAVAVCLFAAALLRARGHGENARFLFAAGGITALLMIDDVFMLHEVVFPDAGVSETVVFGAYGLVLVAFFLRFRERILGYDHLLLVLALAAFGTSVAVDATDSVIPYRSIYFWEDGAKLFGIVSWAAYFATTAAARLGEGYEGVPARSARTVESRGVEAPSLRSVSR